MHPIDMQLKLQLKGKHKEARKISDELESNGPDKLLDPVGNKSEDIWMRHKFNRGWFLIQEGKYQEGCKALENGRFLNVYGSPPLETKAPIFNPDKHNIKGKSIIISLEGGYGDEIIHARFATSYKKLGAKSVYLATVPELVSIFSRIEGVDGVITRDKADTVEHDFWVPGFSAGWIAGHEFDENFPSKPYLSPNRGSVELWNTIIKTDKKLKIGIRWAGNPKFEHQQFRRFPIEFITNLSKYDDVQVYSFQRDHNLIQLPDNIVDLQHFIISWEDTMAAIANMDIMITSCTSVAHLSAAMGKETWVIVPILPYHTWTYNCPENNTSPYYECVRLFRQKEENIWNPTFQKLYSEFENRFNLPHVEMPSCDRVVKRLNMGCGFSKVYGFVNADKSKLCNPDDVVDFEKFPYPYKDDEFDHIFAKDILEHLGDTSEEFIKVIQEMYRITTNGGIWEIQVPHWRCDLAIDDPTHKRLITLAMFNLFDKNKVLQKLKNKGPETPLAFEYDIDIEVCDVQFELLPHWKQLVESKKVNQEQLNDALNTLNNVAEYMRVLIQVHKPGRIDSKEFNSLNL
jgi:SAM-dependent methyltransferase